MIPRFSVKNPVFVNMLMLLIIVGGIFAAMNVTLEAFPLVDFDTITVITVYPGASPSEMEKLVTIPIEEELEDLDELEDLTSSSIEGRSMVVVNLKPGVGDPDKVLVDIQNRVNRARLPEQVENPDIRKMRRMFPLLRISLAGDTSYSVLKQNAEALREEILDVKGIGSVTIAGLRDREFWVEIDPERLEYHHISLDRVIDRLKRRNLNLPGGTLKEESEEVLLRTIGEFHSVEEIRNVVIAENERGHTVPLSEIAYVRDTYEDPVTLGHVNGRRSINLRVEKDEKANSILLVDKVRRIVKEYEKKIDPNVGVIVTNDGSEMIRARLNVLMNNGIMGFGLVILLLYLALARKISWITLVLVVATTVAGVWTVMALEANMFASMAASGAYAVLVLAVMLIDKHGRIPLMTALGVPVAVLFSVILLHWYGGSLNMISMFGMIVVLGMLVDDGIVVTENIYRHMQAGMDPHESAIKGANEVFWPINAAIFTTVAAFLPMLLMGGMMGKFMMWIPIIVTFALIGSLVESFLVLPSHLADFARPTAEMKGEKAWFKSLRGFYTWILTKCLRRRYVLLGGTFAVLVVFIWIGFTQLGFQLFPRREISNFSVQVEAPVGTKIEDTEKIIKDVQLQAMAIVPEAEREAVLGRVGETGRGRDREVQSHVGEVTVGLVDADKRSRGGEEIIADFRRRLKVRDDVKISFTRGRHGPPTGNAIDIRIRGEDMDELLDLSRDMENYLAGLPGVKDIENDYESGKPEEHVLIREQQAKELGVDVRRLADQVRFAYEGGIATRVRKGDEDIDVIVRFTKDHRSNTSGLEHLLIPNSTGGLVPFENVADVRRERGPSRINRFNGKRAVVLTADVEKGVTTSFDVNNRLKEKFSARSSAGTHIDFEGEEGDRAESVRSMFQAFWISILLIYMILGALFRSFIQPLVVMFTVPFGIIGVTYGLLVHGQPMSLMAMIGIVALTGVVVNDSLVFVDFINRLRRGGMPLWEAIVRAGRFRLRPILLTTITTMVGLMPLMFQVGGSSSFLTPMAIAIVWGLGFATVLTLIIIPCLYAIIEDVKRFFGRTELPS